MVIVLICTYLELGYCFGDITIDQNGFSEIELISSLPILCPSFL